MEKTIASMKNHYIICGYGRIGSLIAKELFSKKIPFVVVENEAESVEHLKRDGFLFLEMDATTEEALIDAGIMSAKGLVTAVKSDADNVFITLTARSISSTIFILSRGSDEKDEKKLKRAGASRVVLPYLIGGMRMAQALVRPAVFDFVEMAVQDSELGLLIEELVCTSKGVATEKNLIESNIRRDFGIIIVSIKRSDGTTLFNPMPQEVLKEGDTLVVLGKKSDVAKLEKLI